MRFYTVMIDFEDFYRNSNPRTKFTWLHAQSSTEVSTCYLPIKYLLTMNMLQCNMLLQFNESEVITVRQLMNESQLPESTVKKGVVMFFNPKHPLLIKETSGKRIGIDEELRVNHAFSWLKKKLDFTAKPRKEVSRTENDEEAVNRSKKLVIEALIIKLAKGNKRISHTDLIQDVVREITNYQVQTGAIKERIEDLIQRRLLRRDDSDPRYYLYIAK